MKIGEFYIAASGECMEVIGIEGVNFSVRVNKSKFVIEGEIDKFENSFPATRATKIEYEEAYEKWNALHTNC